MASKPRKTGGRPDGRALVVFPVYMPPHTRKALRARALDEGITASSLVVRLIDDYLKGGGRS